VIEGFAIGPLRQHHVVQTDTAGLETSRLGIETPYISPMNSDMMFM